MITENIKNIGHTKYGIGNVGNDQLLLNNIMQVSYRKLC